MGIINFGNKSNTTSVDNDFIVNHMKNLSGDLIKIYLYMLMQNNNGQGISIDEVADNFGIFSSEIIKGLDALSKEGLCTFIKDGDNFSLSFDKPNSKMPLGMNFETNNYDNNNSYNNFISPDMNINKNGQVMFNTDITSSNISKDNVLNFTNNVNNNESKVISDYMNNSISFNENDTIYDMVSKKDKANDGVKESYTAEELAFLLQENDEVNDLKKYIEKLYGATFNAQSLETLVSICSMEYVPTSTLKTIVKYLANNNTKIQKLSPLLNAMEQKAIDIKEKGLTSEDEINDYLTNTSPNYMAIAKRFGILGRAIAPCEKSYIDKWLYDYKVDMNIILEACDKTIKQTNKASFEYCDAIIKNYKDSNRNMDKQNKSIYPNANQNLTPKKSGFNNYSKQNSLSQFEMDNMTKLMNKYGNN